MIKFKKYKKRYLLAGILFIIALFCYNFRFEILYNVSTKFGYDENKARRYSFMFSEKPVQISLNKLRKFFNPKEIGIEKFNIALKVKKNFANNKSLKLNFENGNYFLDIFESKKKSNFNKKQKLEYIDIWKNKAPTKIWSINTSNKILSNSSSKSSFLKSQTSPRICGDKLIYARPDGIIGAVDYKTGKKIWYKQYGNINAGSIRGFYCGYEKHLDIHMVILPTGAGVYCIRVSDGSLITQRCGGKKMGEFESKVSPQLFDKIGRASCRERV